MDQYDVQKRIAFLIFGVGLFVSIVNLLHGLSNSTLLQELFSSSVFLVFLLSLCMLLTALHNHPFVRGIQVFIFIITGGIAIWDSYSSIYGLGLMILAVLLAYKYGFFHNYPITKIIIWAIALFALIEISARKKYPEGEWMAGLDAIAYLSMFFLTIFIIYQDEIKAYIGKIQEKENEVWKLIENRKTLVSELQKKQQQIVELDKQLEDHIDHHKKIDLNKHNITPREEEVIRLLVVYRSSDKEIAEALGISVATVKLHLTHIREKFSVDDRNAIIELCRNNYIEEYIDYKR